MELKMRRAYVGTCVAIYYVEGHSILFPKVMATLFPEEGEAVAPVISDLTRLECRVWPLRIGNRTLLARYDAFFGLPDVQHAIIDRTVFDLATAIRAEHRLKTPDAIHLAAAISANCDELWTNDNRLANAAAGHIRIVLFNETE